MADDDLTVTISANADEAIGATTAAQTGLERLEAAVAELMSGFLGLEAGSGAAEKGITGVGLSSGVSAAKAKELSVAGGELGAVLTDVAEHSLLAARGLDTLGLSTGAAAAKVEGLLGLFTGFGEATAGIMATAGALAVLFAGFEIFKDAISAAAEWDQKMAALGNTVRNQGGDWNTLSKQVEQFIALQEQTTSFDGNEILDSLRRLTAAGISLSDSEKIVRVAEDASAASGKSLSEVVDALKAAEEGRTRGLLELGVATQAQIKDGMSFNDVLAKIEENAQGAAAALTNTLPGALGQLHSAWDATMRELGEPFQTVLVEIVQGITGIVREMDTALKPSLDAFGAWAGSQGPAIADFFNQLWQTIVAGVADFDEVRESVSKLGGGVDTLKDAFNQLEGSVTNGKTGWEGFRDILKQVADSATTLIGIFKQIGDTLDGITAAQNRFADTMAGFWTGLDATIHALPPQVQTLLGFGGISGAVDGLVGSYGNNGGVSGDGSDFPVAPRWTGGGSASVGGHANPPPQNPANPNTGVQTELGGPRSSSSNAAGYDPGAMPAMPDVSDQVDQYQQLAKAVDDLPKDIQGYEDAITALSLALTQAHSQQDAANAALETAGNNAVVARDDYVQYASQFAEGSKLTAAQTDQLKQYKDAWDAANTALGEARTASRAINGDVDALTAALVRDQSALSTAQAAWGLFTDKTDQQTQETLDTFKMTNAQKVTYYAEVVSELRALGDDYEKQAEQAYTKEEQAYVSMVEDQYKAEQQFTKTAGTDMANFVDAIVVEHKSLADELKSIYEDILKSFISMVTQMIVESKLFQSIAGWMFGTSTPSYGGLNLSSIGGFGGGPGSWNPFSPNSASTPSTRSANATSAAVSGASSYGVLGALLGSEGAQEVIASIGAGSSGSAERPSDASSASFHALGAALGGASSSNAAIASAMTGSVGGSPTSGGGSTLFGGGSSSVGDGGGAVFTGGSAGSPSYSSSSSPSGGGASFGGGGGAGASSLFSALFGGGGSGGGSGSGGGAGGINPGGSLFSSGLGGAAGGTIAGLGGIALGGSLFGQLAMGGKGFSDLGGALGGVAAAGSLMAALGTSLPALLAGGPLGWGIIAGGIILGSLLGSLFGDHFSQADEPDIYNQNAWGQENADMQGSTQARPMTANGKQFVMDSQTAQATNNLGWNIMMENFVQMFRKDPTQLSPDLQGAFPEIESLWGGAQNQADFNNNGKNGNLQLGSGEMASYTKFWAYIQNYGAEISALMSNYTASDVYQAGLNGQVTSIGSYTPGGSPGILHDFNDSGSGSGGGPVNVNTGQPTGSGFVTPNSQPFMPGQGLRAGARSTQITINVPVGGSLIAQNNLIEYIRSAVGGLPAFSNADMQTAF